MKTAYDDRNCVFILTVDKKFKKKTELKYISIVALIELNKEFKDKKVEHFKILKSAYEKYRIDFDYEILVKNSIIG